MNNILQWNINGLRHHFEILQKLIHDRNPTIMCLQETNFKGSDYSNIKDYKVYYKNRENCLAASGGAAIYVKDYINCSEIKLNTNLEAVAVECTLSSKCICICSIYIPDSYDVSKDEIESVIEQLRKPYIIVGDFNSRSTVWGSKKTDLRGKIVEKILSEQDIVLLNSGIPTRFNASNGSLSCIDLFLCSPNLADSLTWTVLDYTYDSDHFPIVISIENDNIPEEIYLPRWKFKKANWEEYRRTIEGVIETLNYLEAKTSDEINSIVSHFESIILGAADKAIPKTKSKIGNKNLPWWNEECEHAIKEAKRAFNKYKKRNTFSNKLEFQVKRAISRRTIRKSKRIAWIDYISSLKKNTPNDDMWKKIKSINGKNKQTKIMYVSTSEDTCISNPKEIANLMGKMFMKNSSDSNFNEEFLKNKTEIERDKTNLDEPETAESRILNNEITLLELQETLKQCKNTSAGPDGIPNVFLKNLPHIAILYLLGIFNSIWLHNIFPEKWREATVIPIPKPGKSRQHIESYRPISLTCCLCKLMEKIVNKRLKWFLETNNLISPHQHGFRQFHSTTDNIVTIEKNICDAFINKQHLIAVALDMEKAYDMLWRERILKILSKHQINGNMLKFANNFLKNRVIRVRVNGHLSDMFDIKNGVPQGAVISVTFFLLAIDDIINSIQAPVKFTMYADDVTLLLAGKNIETSQKLLQNTLNDLQKFSHETGFKFSKSKTTVTVFSKRYKKHKTLELFLDGQKLDILNEVKILGVTFDSKLLWTSHLCKVRNECNKRINILKTLASKNWGADQEIIIKTYNALIQSKIDYGCIVYSSARNRRLQTLSPVQNTGARLATGAFRTSPTESILSEANILPLEYRRKKLCLNYALHTMSTPNNYASSIVLQAEEYSSFYAHKKSYPKPLSVRIRGYLNELGVTLQPVTPRKNFKIAPWTIETPTITEIDIQKHNSNPAALRASFYAQISNYSEYKHIYTDAAKISKATGCAVMAENDELLFKLPDHVSVFTSEAFAILKALEYVDQHSLNKTVIFSDSLSTLTAIKNKATNNDMIRNIIEKYNDIIINNNNATIILNWVPSHIGIEANEKVDGLAKRAALSKQPTFAIHVPMSCQESKKLYIKAIYNRWERQWQDVKAQKPHWLRNSIFERSPALSFERKDQVIINRLRIGHTNISHLHLITKTERGECDVCYTELSVKHILIDCPKYDISRLKFKMIADLEKCLNSVKSCINTLAFLTDIDMYHRI